MMYPVSDREMAIIRRYRQHLWDTAKIGYPSWREVLGRIIAECGDLSARCWSTRRWPF